MSILVAPMPKRTATTEEFESDLQAFKDFLEFMGMSARSFSVKIGKNPASVTNTIANAKRQGREFPYKGYVIVYLELKNKLQDKNSL